MERFRFVGQASASGWERLVEMSNQAAAVGLVFLVLGVSAFSALKLPHWWIGLLILLSAYALLLLEGTFRLWSAERGRAQASEQRINELERAPRPHLRFTGTDHAQATIIIQATPVTLGATGPPGVSASTTSSAVGGANDFVRVFVANDPPMGEVGATAEKVVGRVSFIAPDEAIAIDQMLGRWAEAPQRLETGRFGISLEDAQLDIEPNGLPHPLDVAMKRPQDACFYAVNDENALAPDFCLPKHELPGAEYTVRVTLRGNNTDEITEDFELRNEGVGGTIALDRC